MAKLTFTSPLVRGVWFILAVIALLLPQSQQLVAWGLMVTVVASGILLARLRISTVLFVGAAITVRRLQLDDIFGGMVVAGLIGVWALVTRMPIMDNAWRIKVGFVAAVVLGAAVVIWPTAHQLSNGKLPLPSYIRRHVTVGLAKGLDLQGGMRLVYTVEVEEAIADKRANTAEDMRQNLAVAFNFHQGQGRVTREEMVKLEEKARINTPESALIRIKFTDKNDRAKVDDRFQKQFATEMSFALGPADDEVTFKLRPDIESSIRQRAVTQAQETIGRRVDELGLREAAVTTRDEDIIVEVPGQNEQAFNEIKEIIRRTARLEFKMEDTFDFFAKVDASTIPAAERIEIFQTTVPDGLDSNKKKKSASVHVARITKRDDEDIEGCKKRFRAWIDTLSVPDDRQIGFGVVNDPDDFTKEIGWSTHYLFRRAEITGEHIVEAQTEFNQDKSGYLVSLRFSPVGNERFEEVTGANVNRRFAIILDDKVDSAPVIQTKISGGATITMGAGDQETQAANARKLERVLRSGALPAQITPSNESVIGPSLGHDAIDQGLKGMLAGSTLVLLFMFIYYRTAGLVADGAVLLNLFLQLAILASFGATMTLPGIAGLALTIGIAIDANVLINERIREEMRTGRSIRAAIDTGYDKAFTAIIDGHVTVFISGLILAQYGSGPVKGFAVTLIVGIVASLFTGVFCTRLVFDWWARGAKVKRLNIGAEF